MSVAEDWGRLFRDTGGASYEQRCFGDLRRGCASVAEVFAATTTRGMRGEMGIGKQGGWGDEAGRRGRRASRGGQIRWLRFDRSIPDSTPSLPSPPRRLVRHDRAVLFVSSA